MFIEWDFLLAEIWVLLVLAALVGLIAGWLIWGGRKAPVADFHEGELRRLRAELDRAKAAQRVMSSDPLDDVPPMEGGGYIRPSAPPAPAKTPPSPKVAPSAPPTPQTDGPQKPEGLDGPRDGISDDLTVIKGIGPKMEKLCNGLGFWHYDQIAAWSAAEVAWVDDNLKGFKGRVTRDNWVAQAQALADSGPPAFVRRTD